MANENKDIGEIVKKCKILLLDIEGTTTSISFVKDKLFPYAEENAKQFLETQWETDEVKAAVAALRKLAVEDQEKKVEGLIAIPGEDASKEDQIEGLVKNIKWQMSADRKSGALKQLQGLIWQQGYDNGDIQGHVYDDVSSALEQWQSVEGQKVYIYSSGSVQAQKLLFGRSLAGDLLKYIEGHFDTAVGGKREAASYTAIVEKIGCKADEVLFVTDIVEEAAAAREAGVHVALASRDGDQAPAAADYVVIHSLAQLRTNKRKTDPQDEQPAKVPKMDIQKEVKPAAEAEASKEETAVAEKAKEEPEKMETDEEPKKEEKNEKVETISVEEVTDSKKVEGIEVDMEPIVTEVEDSKPEKTEKMETESTDKVEETKKDIQEPEKESPKSVESTDSNKKTEEKTDVPKENKDTKVMETSAPAVDETSTVTEIEEITSDKENLSEMAEIIENLEPVIEEPEAAEEAEKLRNVGDVLEKECDEILSKVQGVTNLDNIPLRPILNPIAEETMEAENTNDIVDSILDTELEIEMKKSEDIATTTAKVKHPEKSPNVEDKSKEKNSVSEETVTESDVKIEITPEQTTPENNKIEKEKVDNEEKLEPKDKPEAVCVVEKSNDKSEVDKETKEDKPKEEVQVNGKATNGETVVENGDVSKEEELSSRLSVENGKEVNSNGDTKKNGEGDKAETEVSDIKVKTVSTEEPRTDLIEQPTEA